MDIKELLLSFWFDVANQNVEKLKNYFATNAFVRWHNTNEQFTSEEYIVANCEYPGDWQGEVERIELFEHKAITATRVWLKDNSASFHVTSFFEFQGDKILVIDEYWGDDGIAPQWRLDKNIGKPIK